MKVQIEPAAVQALRQRLLRWSGHSAVEAALRFGMAMAAGFVLAGARAAEGCLPLAVSLAAALGLGLPSFGAYIGGCLGYAAFFGMDVAMEPMAVGLLVEACLCIFGDEPAKEHPWFLPGATMVFSALVGVLFLLQNRFWNQMVVQYLLKVAVGGLGVHWFRRALKPEGNEGRLILSVSLCAGLCALRPVGFPLGVAAGCALAAAAAGSPNGLTAAALCGLALDLSWGGGGCTTSVILAYFCSFRQTSPILRPMLWLLGAAVGTLLTGSSSLLLAGAMLGTALSPLVPGAWLGGLPQPVRTRDSRAALAAGLLQRMGQCLSMGRAERPVPETNQVFDQAAERVCRHCSAWEQCWETEIERTCEALNRAAPVMMTRGKVLREDLSAAFVENCRHMEGFLTAVNRELDELSCRRQYRNRLRESRQVLAQQYEVLSAALSAGGAERMGDLRFSAEVGFRSQSRQNDELSGDRGASFRVGNRFYLLLCDGMGTGRAAGAEAGAAIGVLRTLLQANVAPADALRLLNGIYILRDDGGFATVDLLQADLTTGEGWLFKWGGAPSYLKKKSKVEKVGTASPPPGIGIGEEYRPEGERLSLGRGEMLVMVSDGAGGEAAERFIRQYGGSSVKELASGVVNCSRSEGEDDRTAAVLVLRPRLSM